jgi:diadenylate cyclase
MDFSSVFFFRWQDLIDISIVTFIIYNILVWTRNRNASRLLQGVLIVLIFYSISHLIGLSTIDWLLQKLAMIMLFVFIIVFQPELRQFLERLGQSSQLKYLWMNNNKIESGFNIQFVQNLIKVVDVMGENKIGSLIVIERMNNLDNIKATGVELDATFSNELLLTVFYGKNPLHDGAVIISNGKIEAAGCLLPLTHAKLIDRTLGTRHRAALGLVELTDAIVIVTSEETGIISLAKDGKMYRKLSKKKLGEHLLSYLDVEVENVSSDILPEGIQNFFNIILKFFIKKKK